MAFRDNIRWQLALIGLACLLLALGAAWAACWHGAIPAAIGAGAALVMWCRE